MTSTSSRVTIHMAASLDGFIARRDGSVDWLETSDDFADGKTLDAAFVETFLETIGDGVPFFDKLDRDIALHLAEVNAYKSGIVELRYEVRQAVSAGPAVGEVSN